MRLNMCKPSKCQKSGGETGLVMIRGLPSHCDKAIGEAQMRPIECVGDVLVFTAMITSVKKRFEMIRYSKRSSP